MATDARISAELPSHPKTKKLIRRLGQAAGWNLTRLFLWTAANRSDGDLSGMTDEDIELAVDWLGDGGDFVRECVDVGFLDGEDEGRTIHDWEIHNPWAAGAGMRSAKARWNSVKRHHGEDEANRQVPDYAAVRCATSNADSSASRNASSNKKDAASNAADATSMKNDASSNAPYPYPSHIPNPSPSPTPDSAELQSSIFATASPVVVEILTNTKALYPVTQAQIDSWAPAYPSVDIPAQLQKIRVWAETNQPKRKTKAGMPKFINAWLGRAQDAPKAQGFSTPFRSKPAAQNHGFTHMEYADGRPPE